MISSFTKSYLLLASLIGLASCSYEIKFRSDGPVIVGATITFRAELYEDDKPATSTYKFHWEDNTRPSHSRTTDYQEAFDEWKVNYTNITPGNYTLVVTVYKYILVFDYPIISAVKDFEITEQLNGEFNIIQNNKTMNEFISNAAIASHEIKLSNADLNFLKNQSMTVLTYWFVDCDYEGVTGDLKFENEYKTLDKVHKIEALVVGGYEPLTTTTTTTTTTAPTTTTATTTASTTTTTTKPSSSVPTSKSVSSSELIEVKNNAIERSKRGIHSNKVDVYDKSLLIRSNKTFKGSPMVCNNTILPVGTGSIYGYFSKVVTVKAPLSNFSIAGNNWVHQGDILHLKIKCEGSKSFSYCLTYYPHVHNVTGNETCAHPITLDSCDFPIIRFYGTPGPQTIVVVISNDINKIVSPITVTVYEVKKQAQLSVIVVPVSFSILAIVLIIFGVSYHIQNRRRFTVEVADFNFGPNNQCADYMTFRERLRESILNTFTRAKVNNSEENSDSGPIWPPNQKYGSMPRF